MADLIETAKDKLREDPGLSFLDNIQQEFYIIPPPQNWLWNRRLEVLRDRDPLSVAIIGTEYLDGRIIKKDLLKGLQCLLFAMTNDKKSDQGVGSYHLYQFLSDSGDMKNAAPFLCRSVKMGNEKAIYTDLT
eukprot:GILJ01017984.1.p1 GENE.GILJ01017984.1~~GILJ01017984.1.p1  ORF type:complete len:132 (+),score=15.58 GILJ01017984.1:141-536(+)